MKIKPSTKRDFQKGDTHIEEQINNLLIETSEEETENTSSTSSEENLNLIQQDDQPSSTDDEEIQQINTLTREQDLLFTIINSIPDPQEKKVFLEKLRKFLETKPKPKDFITNNKFDVSNIFKRLENISAKHVNPTQPWTQQHKHQHH